MNQLKIAKRYAQALFELGELESCAKEIHLDFQSLHQLMKTSDQLKDFFFHPLISFQKRQSILQTLFQDKIHPLLLRFLIFLIHKNRLSLIIPIEETFQKLFAESQDILSIKIFSAQTLLPQQEKMLPAKIKEKFQKNIQAEIFVDSSMIGGFKFQIKDEIYDLSIRSQIERFKNQVLWA